MFKSAPALCAAIVIFSFAGPAIAAPKVDANNDGRITEREYMNYYSAEFIKGDKNFDSRLTQDEIRDANLENLKKMEAERFKKIDVDNDKSVSLEEYDAERLKRVEARNEKTKIRSEKWFDKVDENENGYISRSEYLAYQENQVYKNQSRAEARAKRQFENMDSDGDNALTETEYINKGRSPQAAGPKTTNSNPLSHIRSARSSAQKNTRRDGDGDGIITKSEDEAFRRVQFERMDKDKDGYIVKSENSFVFSGRALFARNP